MMTIINKRNIRKVRNMNRSGILIGTIVLVAMFAGFQFIGLPAIRRYGMNTSSVPTANIVSPDKTDVSVAQTK